MLLTHMTKPMVLWVLLALLPAVSAGVVNGSFETGNFSGWSTIGNTSVLGTSGPIAPTNGSFQARMTNGIGSVSTASLAAFDGVSITTITSLSTFPTVTEGSGIKQTFTANSGDILSFNWDFATNEIPTSIFNDFGFWVLQSNAFLLANTLTSGLVSASAPQSGFSLHTGYRSAMVVIPTTGTYTLGFGVADAGDFGI